MNKVKLIISDMDGTLLNSNKQIALPTIHAVDSLYQKGIQFAVATGRNYREVYGYFKYFNNVFPVISLNGGKIYDEKGYVIEDKPFEEVQLKKIIQFLRQQNVYFEIIDDEFVYSNSIENRMLLISNILGRSNTDPEIVKDSRYIMTKFCSYEEVIERHRNIYKIRVFKFMNENLEGLKHTITNNFFCEITSSNPSNIEINPNKVSKGAGIKKLADYYKSELKYTVGIGDELNDLSMMETVGISFGMENGHSELKKKCHFITSSNNNNGVANVINKAINY